MAFDTIHIRLDQPGARLDAALAAHFADVSRAQIQNWIKDGRVTDGQNKVLIQASLKLKLPLDVIVRRDIKKPFEPPRAEAKPNDLIIVYEDEHLLVVNKPVGISVHPGAGRKDGTLVNMLLGHTGGKLSDLNTHERPGIVHRLDKDTSGLMMVAKTNAVHAKLADDLQKRIVKRVYQAIVWNVPVPASGVIETLIGRDPKNRQRMSVVKGGGKSAITYYKNLQQFGLDFALVECRLETGRTHQIRVHLASVGCPVLGDPLYVGRQTRQLKRFDDNTKNLIASIKTQMLHAGELRFVHPVTQDEIHLFAEPPELFQDVLTQLANA